MNNNLKKLKSGKKPSTFDKYVTARSAEIAKIVQQALRVVDATKYGTITDYCKALAGVISEVREAKSGDPTTPFFNKKVRSFSYITLLRNVSYRSMVDSVFNHGRESLEHPKAVSEEALLRISSLQAQVNLLKDRLSGIRTGDNSNALVDANAQDTIKKLAAYLNTTLTVYSTMRQRFQQVTKVVSAPTEKEKIAGLYSSVGFIAELEALHEIEDGRKFLEQLSISDTAIQ
ncbi:hypothetical protein QEP21_17885 [Pseudomonas shirazica]|uniref:hypothetical protein n=1 Tax=Pseudomonas shirazica TaxID=1940636 RepID=UPI002453454E|nr:hypothetical protein [Pseudomonas shirazica]MDH4432206.1 hypothetical protein [Pseudomonas shirazica]